MVVWKSMSSSSNHHPHSCTFGFKFKFKTDKVPEVILDYPLWSLMTCIFGDEKYCDQERPSGPSRFPRPPPAARFKPKLHALRIPVQGKTL